MIAYNHTWLFNLSVIKESKRWLKQAIISREQFDRITAEHPSSFYHPNPFIRILLFLATLVALGGVTGLLGLMFADVLEDAIEVVCVLYGIGSWVFLEMVFIRNGRHYKSGVNEALLYHSIGWTLGGLAALTDFNEHAVIILFILIFTFAAIRYADLICTIIAFGSFGYFIFSECYQAGGIMQFIIPFIFIVVFTPAYFAVRYFRGQPRLDAWEDSLIIVEALCLITIYAAGNYFVVRELSEKMMGLYVEPGNDIPYAAIFYALTVLIPIAYLYFGLKHKNVILLRVSLLAVAFSVFTFKYYYSLGHPEITLTIAGAILLAVSMAVFRYLRTPRHGYTRDNVLTEKWADANPEAFIISQTLGGNKVVTGPDIDAGGGGKFGGGGSSDSF